MTRALRSVPGRGGEGGEGAGKRARKGEISKKKTRWDSARWKNYPEDRYAHIRDDASRGS